MYFSFSASPRPHRGCRVALASRSRERPNRAARPRVFGAWANSGASDRLAAWRPRSRQSLSRPLRVTRAAIAMTCHRLAGRTESDARPPNSSPAHFVCTPSRAGETYACLLPDTEGKTHAKQCRRMMHTVRWRWDIPRGGGNEGHLDVIASCVRRRARAAGRRTPCGACCGHVRGCPHCRRASR